MQRASSPEELRPRLLALLRQAKGLHGDLTDRRLRSELRAIANRIGATVNTFDEQVDDKTCLAAYGHIEAISARLGELEGFRSR